MNAFAIVFGSFLAVLAVAAAMELSGYSPALRAATCKEPNIISACHPQQKGDY